MKHLKTFESTQTRRVYWIVPSDDKFEDSLVSLMIQYSSKEDTIENRIEIVDKALGMINNYKELIKSNKSKSNFAIVYMLFAIENNKVVVGPNFSVTSLELADQLEENGFIFVGFQNINKEEYDLYLNSKKYNL